MSFLFMIVAEALQRVLLLESYVKQNRISAQFIWIIQGYIVFNSYFCDTFVTV